MTADEVVTQKAAKPPLRARLRVMVREAIEIYGRFDPRSMGLARIGLGLLLIWDLLRRVPDLATWYSNEGLLPNHTVLWRPNAIFSHPVVRLHGQLARPGDLHRERRRLRAQHPLRLDPVPAARRAVFR